MIKEIVKNSPNKYGKYFLSFEAPGDDEIPVKKSNTRVIDVKPNNRHRLDFTDGAEEIEEIPEEPSEEIQGEDELDTDKSFDFSQDENEISADDSETSPEDDGTDPTVIDGDNPDNLQNDDLNGETTPITNDGDNPDNLQNDDINNDTEPTVTDGDGETEVNVDDVNGPDVDNQEDFNSDMGEEDMVDDNGQPIEGDQPPAEDAKKGPGLEYDSTRKYLLFENYVSLVNSINNYITKLESTMGDDMNENKIIKTVTSKLREIHDLCYDFMTMKFEISTYVQSLLFFQNAVIMIQLVFDLLEKTKKKIKNNNK